MLTPFEIIATSWHEVGHGMCFDYYGVENYQEVFREPMPVANSTIMLSGACHVEGRVTPWQGCVVGWAGILAQCLGGHRYPWMPEFKPSTATLRDFHNEVYLKRANLSPSDRELILGCCKRSWLACRFAFRILGRDRKKLRTRANNKAKLRLKELAAANPPAPTPSDVWAAKLEAHLADHPEDAALKDTLARLKQGLIKPMSPTQTIAPDSAQQISPPESGGANHKEKET